MREPGGTAVHLPARGPGLHGKAKRATLVISLLLPIVLWATSLGGSAALAAHRCAQTYQLLVDGLADPVTAGGVTRINGTWYFITYSRTNEWARQGSYGVITPHVICGPNLPEETISSDPITDAAGPYPGLEAGGQAFVIAFTASSATKLEERTLDGTYDQATVFQEGLTAVTLQRIASSLTRLSISIDPVSGTIYTQTVKKQDPGTWGSLLATDFGVSAGNTGSNLRASAAWTGNQANKSECVMAWEYDKNHDGNRVLRNSINSDYHGNSGWRHARTLVSIPGKDLSDPYVFRWQTDVRVYFVERDLTGAASVAYMTSSDQARTWTGPFDVPFPAPLATQLVDITGPVLAKSLDKLSPVVLIGGKNVNSGQYLLVAFREQ